LKQIEVQRDCGWCGGGAWPPERCGHCGGDGWTIDAAVCPDCEGTGIHKLGRTA
jgi:hypothetical protein